MNVFLIGAPKSGRTTVARSIVENCQYKYIDATSWVKATFRECLPNEHLQQYLDEYYEFLTKRLNANPHFIIDNVYDVMKSFDKDDYHFVIDGLMNPKDFVHLFDYRKDIVIFLNRTDNDIEHNRDQDTIAISSIRDYCYWLASANLLQREKWFEYNYKIPGEDSVFVKTLGSKNSVFIVKSIGRAISHLQELLKNIK